MVMNTAELRFTVIGLMRPPSYFGQFNLTGKSSFSVIFSSKEPFSSGHPVNMARFLRPAGDLINGIPLYLYNQLQTVSLANISKGLLSKCLCDSATSTGLVKNNSLLKHNAVIFTTVSCWPEQMNAQLISYL